MTDGAGNLRQTAGSEGGSGRFGAGVVKVAVFCAVFAAVAGGGIWGWKHNRMSIGCLVTDIYKVFAEKEGRQGAAEEQYGGLDGTAYKRWRYFRRYGPGKPNGQCGPENEEKLWAEMERTSHELDWRESHYWLAVKKGYGDDGSLWMTFSSDPATADGPLPDTEYGMPMFAYKGRGDGGDVRFREGFSLMTRAAEQGVPDAQLELSEAYRTGKWGWQGSLTLGLDAEKSARWLEKSAEEAYGAHTAFAVGYRWRYAEEFGLEPDYAKARDYFLSAAKREHPAAMAELALMHAKGLGGDRDIAKAKEWMAKADELAERLGSSSDYGDRFYAKLQIPPPEIYKKLRTQLAQLQNESETI